MCVSGWLSGCKKRPERLGSGSGRWGLRRYGALKQRARLFEQYGREIIF